MKNFKSGSMVFIALFTTSLLFAVGCSSSGSSKTADKIYTITATAGLNGTISPTGEVEVNAGENQVFNFTANSGYAIDIVTVDGSVVTSDTTYTFSNVTADHSISVTFKLVTATYSITATTGFNGTISPAGAVSASSGSDVPFSFVPDSGYAVEKVLIDGEDFGALPSYSFNTVSKNHTIEVSFVASASTSNLLSNPSVETVDPGDSTKPQYWTNGSWTDGPTNVVTFSWLTGDAHTGTHSLKTEISNYSVDGDAKWYAEYISATKGTLYEYSDWYKSNTESYLVVSFYTWDNATSTEVDKYETIATLAPASDWTRVTAQFSVPEMPAGLTINMSVLHLIQSNGWVITDDASLQSYVSIPFDRALVSVTFDDGLLNTYNNGKSILVDNAIPATFYILSANLGETVDGISYLTEANLLDLHTLGFEVGSHTLNHPDLTTLSVADIDTQLHDSRTALQGILHATSTPVIDFASPYGSMDQIAKAEIKKYYSSHRGVISGFNSKDKFDPYNLVVQDVERETTSTQIVEWLDQAKATNTWLILVFHGVVDGSDQYSISPANLNTFMGNIKDSGITVKTVNDALTEILSQVH